MITYQQSIDHISITHMIFLSDHIWLLTYERIIYHIWSDIVNIWVFIYETHVWMFTYECSYMKYTYDWSHMIILIWLCRIWFQLSIHMWSSYTNTIIYGKSYMNMKSYTVNHIWLITYDRPYMIWVHIWFENDHIWFSSMKFTRTVYDHIWSVYDLHVYDYFTVYDVHMWTCSYMNSHMNTLPDGMYVYTCVYVHVYE